MFKKFSYETQIELENEMDVLGVKIPLSNNTDVLGKGIDTSINGKRVFMPNAICIHPMEGCDGLSDGSPSELTFRRYKRFASGGAGILWFEATAVREEGKANPRQLAITEMNVNNFKQIVGLIDTTAIVNNGYAPYKIIQLTHSGRYSNAGPSYCPSIAVENPYLDKYLPEYYQTMTDQMLDELIPFYVVAAKLAKEAGFDAVDIKSCHRYLGSELMSAFTREGRYGGGFENRSRFLMNIIKAIKSELGNTIDLSVRMNAFDFIPYPYGFGATEDSNQPDFTEAVSLAKQLYEAGVSVINVSAGNPYYNPHVGRPYDIGSYIPPESQLLAIERLLMAAREVQIAVPEAIVVSTGFTWLREFGVNVAAAGIEQGWFKSAGFGRQSFAYPDFAKDILKYGKLKRNKCCICCSKCTVIMRDRGMTGCVIRDSGVYAPIYKRGREGKPACESESVAEHI